MGRSHRATHTQDGTPIQQSLTIEPQDYAPMNVSRLMLGVVLAVYPADTIENRAAQQREDRRGITHECDVLILNDGTSAYMTLRNVVITPDSASGLDDYEEKLPRASSCLTTGEEFNSQLQQIDPGDLDGDWCVVGFVGGLFDSPFILRYWPNPRNVFDPASSGVGLEGDTLEQSGRYFRRTNGVEHVITSKGDIILSTTYASSALAPGEDPELGRFARQLDDDVGGAVRVYIKPSQSVELSFNEQEDGIGVLDAHEPELPQTNPPQQTPQASGEVPNTYILINKERVESRVPIDHVFYSEERFVVTSETSTEFTVGTDFVVTVDGEAEISSDGTLDLRSGDVLTLEGTNILHGADAQTTEPILLGQAMQDWLASFTVDSPFGPLPATAAYVQTLVAQVGSTKNFVE